MFLTCYILISYTSSNIEQYYIAKNTDTLYCNELLLLFLRYSIHQFLISPPSTATMVSFWQMIYQEKVQHIVLLANLCEDGIVKCERYWPTNQHDIYGHVSHARLDSEIYRRFEVF